MNACRAVAETNRALAVVVPGRESIAQAVQHARACALRNPVAWGEALAHLTGEAENDIIFAAMDGDATHAGRVLIRRLQDAVIAAATQRAKDDLDRKENP